jgi:endonuclease YncB( thermonuclease family)
MKKSYNKVATNNHTKLNIFYKNKRYAYKMGQCISFTKQKATEEKSQKDGLAYDAYIADIIEAEYKTTRPFVVPIERGKVIKTYDGDTITIAAKLPYKESPIYRFNVRLNGIDTPEIKSTTAQEKSMAINARDALHELIYGKMVELKNVDTEKYGRVLADIWLEDIHVNQWLLDNKYAVKYDGGKKQTFI